MTLDTRKYKLIELITGLEDEKLIAKLEKMLIEPSEGDWAFLKLIKPLRKKTDIEEIAKEQGVKAPTKEEIEAMREAADFSEPLEELLRQIEE